MISLLISGHSYEHDLYELIRAFFPDREIVFISSLTEYHNDGYLIQSILYDDNKEHIAVTKISKDNEVLSHINVDIKEININQYSHAQILKLMIKKSLYNALSIVSNKIMTWGILTGIRPTKIIHNLLDLGYSKDKATNILTNEYKLHNSKANLLWDISKVQRKHLYPIDKDKYSLYISIPFCPTICSYCSFSSLPINKYKTFIEEYINNLIYEIEETSKFMSGKKLNTVYIGGGTPTAISPLYLDKIINALYKNFGDNTAEFTVEAGRPDTINKEMLSMLSGNNIQRISINPQTMVDSTLKSIGRNHSSKDVIECFYLARQYGFSVINMDLILGLPGEGEVEIKRTLDELKKLNPENLTIHSLSLKRGSDFKENTLAIKHINDTNIDNMINQIEEHIKELGLAPYYLYRQKQITGNLENIGYSKKDMECIYNISMMEEKETIIGLGMGAVSKIYYPEGNKIQRVPNFKGINDYINRIDELIKNKKDRIK